MGVIERHNPGVRGSSRCQNRWPMLASGICRWKLVRLSLSPHQMASPPYFTRLTSTAEFFGLAVSQNITVDLFNLLFFSTFSPPPPQRHPFHLPAGPADPLSAQALQQSVICINICFILASNAGPSPEEEAFLMWARAAGLRVESWHLRCRIFLLLYLYFWCFQSDYSCSLQLFCSILLSIARVISFSLWHFCYCNSKSRIYFLRILLSPPLVCYVWFSLVSLYFLKCGLLCPRFLTSTQIINDISFFSSWIKLNFSLMLSSVCTTATLCHRSSFMKKKANIFLTHFELWLHLRTSANFHAASSNSEEKLRKSTSCSMKSAINYRMSNLCSSAESPTMLIQM